MKHKLLLLCLLFVCSNLTINAQVYDSAVRYRMISPTFGEAVDTLVARAAVDPGDTGEESHSFELQRWADFMGKRISLDVPINSDMYAPMRTALYSYMYYYNSYCSGSGFTGDWKCLGPFTNEYGTDINMGRITALWVDPDDSNTILAGADGGGLWKSTNDGHSWHNITDGTGSNRVLGMPQVSWIAVNPLNKDIIYIALCSAVVGVLHQQLIA